MMTLTDALAYLAPIAESADPTMRYGEALHVLIGAVDVDLSEMRARDREIAALEAARPRQIDRDAVAQIIYQSVNVHEMRYDDALRAADDILESLSPIPAKRLDRDRVLAILTDHDYNNGGAMRWQSGKPTERAHKVADRIMAEALSAVPVEGEVEWGGGG